MKFLVFLNAAEGGRFFFPISKMKKKTLDSKYIYRTKRFRLKVTDFKPLEGGFSCGKPPPKGYRCSGHFETKVANETTHKLGVADQKILSD